MAPRTPTRTAPSCMPRLLAAAGAVVLAGALAGCGDATADAHPDKRSFPLEGRALTVEAKNAEVELRAADVDAVEVTRWSDGWSVGGGVSLEWSMADDTLRLALSCGGVVMDCAARHEVLVPRGVSVTVTDTDGSVTARGFDTPLKLSTEDGRVSVTDVSGPVELSSGDGSVVATAVSARRVAARSEDGAVRLDFTSAPDRVTASTRDGSVLVALPEERYRVDATSGDGGVRVEVPRDDSASRSVSARSDDGSVRVTAR